MRGAKYPWPPAFLPTPFSEQKAPRMYLCQGDDKSSKYVTYIHVYINDEALFKFPMQPHACTRFKFIVSSFIQIYLPNWLLIN